MEHIELRPNQISILQPTVVLRNACKHYGFKTNRNVILNNLNMTVSKGVIYGLLGSSGCGKTTLLNCIIGQKALDSGKVWVLGGEPNTIRCKIPGPQIGYMPQSMGVQHDFTINETMQYFGKIYGLTTYEINTKLTFLESLLMLPNRESNIGSLSGGEQRRVSFSLAILHEPELVILDEPTVGLDPLLRDNIWQYLHKITSERQTTVILSTHYVDETYKANMVALLREGKILAEESPNTLLTRLHVTRLDEAFLKLSIEQGCYREIHDTKYYDDEYDRIICSYSQFTPKKSVPTWQHLQSMVWKHFLWFKKNPALLLMSILLPTLPGALLDLTLGKDPINIDVAVVNNETGINNCSVFECSSINLGCHFLKYLQKNSTFNLIQYNSEEEAIQSVLQGVTYASIYLKPNYSLALQNRFLSNKVENSNINDFTIDVFRDVASYHTAVFIKSYMFIKVREFIYDYLNLCDVNGKIISPIKWEQPIYGKELPDFAVFAIPSIFLITLFFFTCWPLVSGLLAEKNNGVTERILVAGVKTFTIIVSHLLSNLVLIILQLALALPYNFLVIKLPLQGSFILVVLITVITAIFGISFGILLYSVCSSHLMASTVLLGFYFPASVLSGLIWPVEGMPLIIRNFAVVIPFSGMSDSYRSILLRGWDLTHPQLYRSITIMLLWIVASLIISCICLKFEKKT